MQIQEVIKRPLVTEKALAQKEERNVYSFVVPLAVHKGLIRAAVEQLFKVNVIHVNTSIVRGKAKRVGRSVGRRPNFKKATVELKEGEKIEIFEGV